LPPPGSAALPAPRPSSSRSPTSSRAAPSIRATSATSLNIFVIKNIAPDIPLADVVWGIVPFVILMTLAVVVFCFLLEIAMWLPDKIIANVR
jgi:hypothetical protein